MESITNQTTTAADKNLTFKFMSNSKPYDWLGEDVEGKQPPFDAVNHKYMEPDRNYDTALKPIALILLLYPTFRMVLRLLFKARM